MRHTDEYLQNRLETCRRLYFQYEGREHSRIEREMRAMGFLDFNRRCLYARGINSGWIERYGWDRELRFESRLQPASSRNRLHRRVVETRRNVRTACGNGRVDGIEAPPEQKPPKGGTQNLQRQEAAGVSSPHVSKGAAGSREPRARHTRPPLNAFHAWIKKVSPPMFDWDAAHLQLLIKTLQLFTEGKIKRLMIFMPPRHGKSELVTIRYTAWRLLMEPALKVIPASYNQNLANRFSRNIRNTLAEHFSQTRVAKLTKLRSCEVTNGSGSSDRGSQSLNSENSKDPENFDNFGNFGNFRNLFTNSSAEWETGQGGGVKAVGVGGGITGYGAGLMMIDDPIKSREQAESASYRDKVWHWFNDDMMTRLEPDAGVILIQTRWHEDDLAGRLLKQQEEEGTDEWHVLSLPAICEESVSSPTVSDGPKCADGWKESVSSPTVSDGPKCVDEWKESVSSPTVREGAADHWGPSDWTAGTPACHGCESSHVHADDQDAISQPPTASAALGGMAGKGACGPACESSQESEKLKRCKSENDRNSDWTAGTPACNGCESSHVHAGTQYASPVSQPHPASAACGGMAGKGACGPAEEAIERIDARIKNLSEPKTYPYVVEHGKKIILFPPGEIKPEFRHEEIQKLEKQKQELQRRIRNRKSAIRNRRDCLGRLPGQALWPERFDIKALERIRKQMGSYSFAALYQQKPVPTEGGMFKRSWFTIVQVPPPDLKWKRGFDLSFTGHAGSDYSATAKVAFDKDGVLYIDDVFRGKLEYPLQRKMLMHYIKAETRVEHGIELSANGHAILQELRRTPSLYGRSFRGIKVETSKVTRALPWIALAEEGRVRLVAGRWNQEFIDEACSFPHGHHDDQIDAVSIAVSMHLRKRNRFWTF